MADIVQSTRDYEVWLRRQLGRNLVAGGLSEKHEKMCESPFTFLRATYWRWAEMVADVCPDAMDAPQVLSVGDIHLENFGTWRDADGRLVWGVNDFDEAAEMPYPLDLVRLAASALIAGRQVASTGETCAALLRGYRSGLDSPRPFVLDRDCAWLRELVVVSEKKRAKFWKKIESSKWVKAPPAYRAALLATMPAPRLSIRTARRTAGTGSLGRPRWIAMADWNGAPVVREAKAVIVSAWLRAHGGRKTRISCQAIANGHYRAVDPWHRFTKSTVVRRLSPNNRKVEVDDDPAALLSSQMLEAMGFDLASVHLGVVNRAAAIKRNLARRKSGWLEDLATKMAAAVDADFAVWKGSHATG